VVSEALHEGNLDRRSALSSSALVIRWHRCDLVDIAGELDCATAAMLEVALQPMLERGGVVGIGVGDLVFMDAAGLNVL
jgi:anti-anti-sigma factor